MGFPTLSWMCLLVLWGFGEGVSFPLVVPHCVSWSCLLELREEAILEEVITMGLKKNKFRSTEEKIVQNIPIYPSPSSL